MSKITPGPWIAEYRSKVDEWWIGLSPKEGSMTFAGKSFGFDRYQAEANARLIAAAPEMLEALKSALKLVSELSRQNPENPAKFDGLWASYQNEFSQAIAKAEGRE